MSLFHFTCAHAAGLIKEDRTLRVQSTALMLWLTDLEAPPRAGLQLTSHALPCDRMEYRFEVPDPVDVVPFLDVLPLLPVQLQQLADTPGSLPAHWFVTRNPQRVTRWRRWGSRAAFERGAA